MWKRRRGTEQAPLVTDEELTKLARSLLQPPYSPAELATALVPYLSLQEVRRLNASTDKLFWITVMLLAVTVLLFGATVLLVIHSH